jgi:hypothetical protein
MDRRACRDHTRSGCASLRAGGRAALHRRPSGGTMAASGTRGDNVHASHCLQSIRGRQPEEGVARCGLKGSRCQQLRQPGPGAHRHARPADAAPLDGGGASLHGWGVGARGGGSVLEGGAVRRRPAGRLDVATIGSRVLWFPSVPSLTHDSQIGANLRVCADAKRSSGFRSALLTVSEWSGLSGTGTRRRRWFGGHASWFWQATA